MGRPVEVFSKNAIAHLVAILDGEAKVVRGESRTYITPKTSIVPFGKVWFTSDGVLHFHHVPDMAGVVEWLRFQTAYTKPDTAPQCAACKRPRNRLTPIECGCGEIRILCPFCMHAVQCGECRTRKMWDVCEAEEASHVIEFYSSAGHHSDAGGVDAVTWLYDIAGSVTSAVTDAMIESYWMENGVSAVVSPIDRQNGSATATIHIRQAIQSYRPYFDRSLGQTD